MRIIWTDHAIDDVTAIREYLLENESPLFVERVTAQILDEVASLSTWPSKGVFISELEDLQLVNYRQLLAGQHRIIIERDPRDICYIHIVAHTTRDLGALIRRRLGAA